MKKIIRKVYIDYEKEEKWLNDMCSNGYGLVDYSWCKYTFEECTPNEYIYRLEMLEHLPNSPEGQKYLEFLKETGIEHVATYIRWVFLRKNSKDGEFNLFTDIESKVKHHMRIALFLLPIGLLNIVIGTINIINNNTATLLYSINLFLGSIVVFHVVTQIKKALNLKNRKKIFES